MGKQGGAYYVESLFLIIFVCLTGSPSSYGHSSQQMSTGYQGGYSGQSSMGGYNDYSKCQLCVLCRVGR